MTASSDRRAEIEAHLAKAALALPPQGPIGVFVAQNALAGFEDRPFLEAVIEAGRLFEAEPFLPESQYRDALATGRIRPADLEAALDGDPSPAADAPLAGGRITRRQLHLALLLHPLRLEDDAAVRWTLTESDLVARETESGLWPACLEAVALSRPAILPARLPVRHRDLIHALHPTTDADALVHPLLIRLCAAFLDQGVAGWPMPHRDRGLLGAVAAVYGDRLGPTAPWARRLPAELGALAGSDPHDLIAAEIDRLGVPAARHGELARDSLVALRGWAGMIHQLEQRPDRFPVAAVPARLADFLALRLLLDRLALEWLAPQLGQRPARVAERAAGFDLAALWTELCDRHPRRRGPGSLARALLLCQVARLVGLGAADIRSLGENELLELEWAITACDGTVRRRLFHLAYERRHRIETLDGLTVHATIARPPAASRPALQVITCMDDRCESFRRHLEEQGPGIETFGTAGFFAVPISFRGIDDWHATPLCPIIMRPAHTVVEEPVAGAEASHQLRQRIRRGMGWLRGGLASGSRTLLRGGLLAAVAGSLAAVPLVARVVFPRFTSRLRRSADALTRQRVATQLLIERQRDEPLPDGTRAGFDVAEMADIVRRVLDDIGLVGRFARLVAVIGHGSTSLNNPHESAYDCGACGGGRGGPNARVFALMANDPRVRARLAGAGVEIPADTRFVGGMQDTCSDACEFFDTDRLPAGHLQDFSRLRLTIDEARTRDAHERCRRFGSAAAGISPAEALRHVEARAGDLAQVRPEYGHATNAICVVGRRWRTRGLFLDRRAFLVSYEPDHDADGAILARTLAAVGPVGSGINLAYLFSRVDPRRYGCGTKLPHNITGLIGVMDGHASDLRTGLPWQTVEIHEPVRLLLVIDAPQERILRAAAGIPAVERLVTNGWVSVAAWDPAGDGLAWFDGGAFVPHRPECRTLARVARSADWYAGHRGNLPPAVIAAGLADGTSAGATPLTTKARR
ncbi:MAG: DUF2309 domain-containing protein [Planctomycetota bacterium]